MVGVRLSYSEVKNKIDALGYKLVTREYVNAKQKLVLSDVDGYLYYSTYSNLLSGRKPQAIIKFNPFLIKNFINYFRINGLNSEFISADMGKRIVLTLRCKCGAVYKTDWCHVYERSKDLCNRCSLKNKGEKRRHSLEFIKNEFIKYGYTPLFDAYHSCEQPLPCENSDGYRGMLAYNNLITGYSFGTFKASNPYILYNMDLFVEKTGYGCKVAVRDISHVSKLVDARIPIKCACGNIYDVNWINFMWFKMFRCKKCSSKQSSYEYKTKKHLDYYGVNYIEEYRFDDCKNILTLPFDFAVKNGDNIALLIEVDGRQHYYNYNHPESLVSQKERDSIKTNYCQSHGIPLLRIPYWVYTDSDGYKKRIENSLKKCGLIDTTQE